MGTVQRAELQVPVPYVLALPIQLWEGGEIPRTELALEGLGIRPEEVRERLVRLESQRTRVRTAQGRLKERVLWAAEVSLQVRDPRTGGTQEIRCGSEGRPDRSFFRTRVELRPWISRTQVDWLTEADGAAEGPPVGVELIVQTASDSPFLGKEAKEQQSG
ncbi:uncharacterized protein si:ch211-196f5.2 [Scyliorhinus canicula]|uniref:uncharacterized protein si:ch211-196f5.2 n=1 Tax=Scyliorhinus canicula TaxID=7830 RepID=UPI0018F35736|nr:uncharacterized protein si:ch211-196f5.2 [Scyliorhinus canicula]